MKILNKPNKIHVPTALESMTPGEKLAIPNRVASELKVRQFCTAQKKKGYEFFASISEMPDATVVTRTR